MDEAERAVWLNANDPRLWRTIAAVWSLADRLCQRRFTPGLHRHRSIEAANRQTETWEAETVARARLR